jgi:hypothetical protein
MKNQKSGEAGRKLFLILEQYILAQNARLYGRGISSADKIFTTQCSEKIHMPARIGSSPPEPI